VYVCMHVCMYACMVYDIWCVVYACTVYVWCMYIFLVLKQAYGVHVL
jgi:hypothetical protein